MSYLSEQVVRTPDLRYAFAVDYLWAIDLFERRMYWRSLLLGEKSPIHWRAQ